MTLHAAIRSEPRLAIPARELRTTPSRRGVVRTSLALAHAGVRDVRIRWECVGAADAPVWIVQGGISAHRHLHPSAIDDSPGWWTSQVGRGLPLDPDRHALLAIDWLGADGDLDVPIDTADQADAIAAVLERLGIARVDAFVGASYGAMVGLQFAARHGVRLGRLVAISGAHRSHPDASASRALQRRVVALGEGSREALALARGIAMLGYRTADELEARFGEAPRVEAGVVRCASEDWLDACGDRFAGRFPPRAFVRLSESIDLHRVEPARVRVPVSLVGVHEDRIVPFGEIEALAAAIGPGARIERVHSRYGHDAFLKEDDAIASALRRALRGAA